MCERHQEWERRNDWLSSIRWCYVTGGRALHAFLPGADVPMCGQQALRGPDDNRRVARWHLWARGSRIDMAGALRWSRDGRRRHQHHDCARLVAVALREV